MLFIQNYKLTQLTGEVSNEELSTLLVNAIQLRGL